MENKYWMDIDGKMELEEELALGELLRQGILFCNTRKYKAWKGEEGETIVLFLNCNDVFAWGCADAEDVKTGKELEDLFKLYEEFGEAGTTKWVCLKRNSQPQAPVQKWMKKKGAWDETMDALPENHYDKYCRESMKKTEKSSGELI